MQKIAPVNEILGSMLSSNVTDKSALQADPKSYIFSHYNLDVSTDIELAENTASEVHLSLPYYSGLEEASAKVMKDNDLSDVAGGDVFAIVISLIVASAVSGAAAAAVATAGGVMAATANDK